MLFGKRKKKKKKRNGSNKPFSSKKDLINCKDGGEILKSTKITGSLLINHEKTRGNILQALISNFLIYETNFRSVQTK